LVKRDRNKKKKQEKVEEVVEEVQAAKQDSEEEDTFQSHVKEQEKKPQVEEEEENEFEDWENAIDDIADTIVKKKAHDVHVPTQQDSEDSSGEEERKQVAREDK
jgi:hypothetical protein